MTFYWISDVEVLTLCSFPWHPARDVIDISLANVYILLYALILQNNPVKDMTHSGLLEL